MGHHLVLGKEPDGTGGLLGCVWKCWLNPIVPNGFADHYPVFKWLAIIGNIPNIFRQTHLSSMKQFRAQGRNWNPISNGIAASLPFLNPPTEMYLGTVLNNGEQVMSRRSQRGLLRCLAKGTYASVWTFWNVLKLSNDNTIPHDGSMVLLYMVLHGSHQQKPPSHVSIHIPAPWIPWQYFTIIW